MPFILNETETERTCTKCGTTKPLAEFVLRTTRHRLASGEVKHYESRLRTCKACVRAQHKEWRDANPEKTQAWTRRGRVRRYGLSLEEYEQLLSEQGGVCAICRQPETTVVNGAVRALVVDHDHTTGVVRGLLCDPRNRAIGSMRDDPERLRAAAAYLEER